MFELKIKDALALDGPHKLEQLQTLTGEVDTDVAPEAAKFCDNIP